MHVGFFAIGIAATAEPDALAAAARTAEECGFHSIWAPEHVVLLDRFSSKYPYSADGSFPAPTTSPILDPLLALTYAAAVTRTIRLGTGICLLPERNPVVTAKEVATLDVLSGGRFDFGVGIGWLEEEFVAVGVPWPRRAARTREYLRAMKRLWTEEQPDFAGGFVSFPKVRCQPKPVQKPHPPVFFGGESDAALRRAAEVGDGWFGFNATVDEARRKITRIRELAVRAGRDARAITIAISPGLGSSMAGIVSGKTSHDVARDEIERFRDAGVDEIIVGAVVRDRRAAEDAIRRLAESVVAPAARL